MSDPLKMKRRRLAKRAQRRDVARALAKRGHHELSEKNRALTARN